MLCSLVFCICAQTLSSALRFMCSLGVCVSAPGFVCLSVRLFFCRFVCLFVCLFVCRGVLFPCFCVDCVLVVLCVFPHVDVLGILPFVMSLLALCMLLWSWGVSQQCSGDRWAESRYVHLHVYMFIWVSCLEAVCQNSVGRVVMALAGGDGVYTSWVRYVQRLNAKCTLVGMYEGHPKCS
jgi:hypothetical protein